MRVNLPNPPAGSNRYLYNLIANLTKIFTKIRPASGWKDKEAAIASARVAGAKQPTWSQVIDGIYAFLFSPTTINEVYIAFHLPHDMALSYTQPDGTLTPPKFYLHVHWMSDGTDTGTARFGFEYSYAKGYGTAVYPSTATVYVEQASDGVALTHNIAELSDDDAISSAEFETDGILMLRVFRDATHANDTLTDSTFITFIDFHYLSDGLETVERNRGTGTVPWHKQSVL